MASIDIDQLAELLAKAQTGIASREELRAKLERRVAAQGHRRRRHRLREASRPRRVQLAGVRFVWTPWMPCVRGHRDESVVESDGPCGCRKVNQDGETRRVAFPRGGRAG